MTNANPAVPGHNDRGFTYVAGQNVTWGGLAYDNSNGSVEYVLPNPESANKPPAALGYFPGDPPVNWGR